MKFSAQEEYGLRCLLAIARATCGSATIPEISRQENLTESHVAKLLMILRRKGFVDSTRGHAGGYSLSKPADKTVVGDVLAALGGRLYDEGYCEKHTGKGEACVHGSGCVITGLWHSIQEAVDGVIYNVTLQDLLTPQDEQPTIRLKPAMPGPIKERMASRVQA
jgi:Rrf2 family protein